MCLIFFHDFQFKKFLKNFESKVAKKQKQKQKKKIKKKEKE